MNTKVCESATLKAKYLPSNIEELTPEMILKAEEELGETPERKQECLKEVRRLINGEADFRPIMDDKFLLRFLRARKFNSEQAFKTLKNFYTFKLRYSKVLTDFRPTEMKHVFDMNNITALPYRDHNGSLLGVGSLGHFDLDVASVNDLFAAILVCGEHLLASEATQICGVVILIDLRGLSLRLVRHVASPTLLYRLVRAVQDCVPVRIKAVHIINEPFYFSILFNMLKPILSEKIKNRFQFHGKNFTNLHKQVPAELLPTEFGGQLGPLDNREMVTPLLTTDSHYEKIIKYGYQEKRAQFIRKKSSMAFGLFL